MSLTRPMVPPPSLASWRPASRLTSTFQGQLFHVGVASPGATPPALNACLYRHGGFPPISSMRFVAHSAAFPMEVNNVLRRSGRDIMAPLCDKSPASMPSAGEPRGCQLKTSHKCNSHVWTRPNGAIRCILNGSYPNARNFPMSPKSRVVIQASGDWLSRVALAVG
jgi:hypothetical protein